MAQIPFYITTRQTRRSHQISLEDILRGEIPDFCFTPAESSITGTVTHLVNNITPELQKKVDLFPAQLAIQNFLNQYGHLRDVDRKSLYHTFYIPKKSGGLRQIDEPNEELMKALRELKTILEKDFGLLYHTSAFAYVPGRCTVDSVKKHQNNKSNWFLKTDFSNFFGSTTLEFTLDMLHRLFPINFIDKNSEFWEKFSQAIELGFLNGGLPQGTPLSPYLTNLTTLPIDHTLRNTLVKKGFIYTRYADDILISHRQNFKFKEVCDLINDTLSLFNAPYRIKDSKTRYGSKAGSNWNLGVMLNKDNQITVGWKKKKQFQAMCTNYILDKKNNGGWDLHDVQVLSGLISYYKMIEPEYFEHIIDHINKKYNVSLKKMIRQDIRGD